MGGGKTPIGKLMAIAETALAGSMLPQPLRFGFDCEDMARGEGGV